jgi:hypothetical protein
MRERFIVVREAIDVVLRHLEALPPSDRREQLRAGIRECLQESQQWDVLSPTDRERDGLMKRLLAVHVGVTKLERDTRMREDETATG